MLETLIPQANVMKKEIILERIKEELKVMLASGQYPRRWDAIVDHFKTLERTPEGRHFTFSVIDFVLWLNGERATYTVPPPPKLLEVSAILRALPYAEYQVQLRERTMTATPAGFGQGVRIPAKKIADFSIADEKNEVKLHLIYEGKPRRISWVNEDGLCSMQHEVGYLVRPLKELLK